jgi:putative ABC transport system permease protein
MLKNYFKIAFRHLLHNRLYSIINITGLAAGITCMLLAILYWRDEHSFDSFHANNPNLYRITTTLIENKGSNEVTIGGTGQVQGPAFKEAVPEVKSYVRILGGDIYSDVISESKTLHLQPLYVDENFLAVFTFPVLRGNPATALHEAGSVVLTEKTAKRFFNSIDVVGKTLKMDADPSFEKLGKSMIISAVVKDPPANSSLQFDLLFSYQFIRLSFEDTNWLNAYMGTFVVVESGADIKHTEQKFDLVYAQHAKEQLAENFKTYGYDPGISYGLQPITAIHLNPLIRSTGNAEDGIINGSNPVYSWMFMGIAFFILLMAGINFINISIACSLKRAKEVGIRKITGGNRRQIIFQFLNESGILCMIAFLLSVLFVNMALPFFNEVAGKQLHFFDALDIKLLFYFLALLGCIILLSGLYPAYMLSHFKPSRVLYNKQKLSGSNLFGSGLVVVQFALAVFLLTATVIYYNQMDYIRTKDLGYNPNNIIRTAVNGDRDYKSTLSFLKNELSKEPSIKMVSFGSDPRNEDVYVNNKSFKTAWKNIDENFLPVMEIPFKAGSNFSSGEKNGAIVNESFVKAAGLLHPVGTRIKINRYWDSTEKTITGVVKDFHFGSLHQRILPMAMYMNEWPDGGLWIKFEKAKQKEAITTVEKIFKKAMPESVYQYDFLDELNARDYVKEKKWQQIIYTATIISFIICCLGLFGLAHLSTYQRIKEIGIRKVLGAGAGNIIALLSRDFLKLVLVAAVIAAPVAWYVMNKWLRHFAYRVNIGWTVFVFTITVAVLIAFTTISLHTLKAAMANPVESLRTE